MKRFQAYYNSMTATYNLGVYLAETKEDAEKKARSHAGRAFSEGEKTLIHCTEIND